MLSILSLVAVIVIFTAIWLAWSGRFLATGALAVANVIVYALTIVAPTVPLGRGVYSAIQAELGLWTPNLYAFEPVTVLQFVTSMFVHGDFFHLLGNLIILLAFALPFEERIGHRLFLVIYLGSGLIAAMAQVGMFFGDIILLIGASGAVFGIIGGFAAMYPRLVVPLPMPLVFIMIFVRMRVIVAAVLFTGLQLALLASTQPGDNTAYWAHLGGLVMGVVLGRLALLLMGEAQETVPQRLDLKDLTPYAGDAGAHAALKQMQANMDEPEVFQAWWERFWQSARDPATGQRVRPGKPGTIVREDGTVVKIGPAP